MINLLVFSVVGVIRYTYTFDLLVFKFISGSFGLLVSKWPVTCFVSGIVLCKIWY